MKFFVLEVFWNEVFCSGSVLERMQEHLGKSCTQSSVNDVTRAILIERLRSFCNSALREEIFLARTKTLETIRNKILLQVFKNFNKNCFKENKNKIKETL
mmetsp:Transcript_6996/g.15585  ORF Transcript_6996/g.15585 Transcript_6996/m.15585 type:complete len:100 (-) Transcript_6996:952-1251(-)